eukprot:TRINITY_DN7028_c0_g1_i1.p1 TRINITY_DN7028_c0_g1~~TRINITY_DN7028_c0_g1_i1.p1  ORF type:complete len:308 (-),score=53.53 TRINITY_DN7028_c0_g1_i1:53-976(-)
MTTNTNSIFSPTFLSLKLSEEEKIQCVVDMFNHLKILTELSIQDDEFKLLLQSIQHKYNDNPFHNFSHVVSVAQMMFLFITTSPLLTILTPKEKFALIMAGLTHDLDHPGLSNTYQVNIKSDIALKYNNISVLENHHLSCCLSLLDAHNSILRSFSKEEKEELTATLTRLILNTDIANHHKNLEKYSKIVDNLDWSINEHRLTVLTLLMKAADISNEARPYLQSAQWASVLFKEYFEQHNSEVKNKLPITPFMDPKNVVPASAQIQFINVFVLPLFQTIVKAVPALHPFVATVESNRESWEHTLSSS